MNKLKNTIIGLFLVGAMLLPFGMSAATPSDYGLNEGDLIRATEDLDVFIVNQYGYKRLFLNEEIFGMYGHLGSWEDVKTVSPATRDAFVTSPYYRVSGGEKVYGLTITGEDSGYLTWVDVTQEEFLLIADVNQIFTINSTELAWYPIGNDVEVTGESVKLSTDNPSAKTLTKNAQGVEFLKVDFSGLNVDDLVIKHSGLGNRSEFTDVYVYVNGSRETSGKVFNSDNEITFRNLGLSSPVTVSFVADLDATSGNEHLFELVEVNGLTSLSGLPVSGNTMRISGAESGTLTVTSAGSLDNVIIGQKGAQVAEFRVEAEEDGEDVVVKRLQMVQLGNVDLFNPKVFVDDVTYSGFVNSDDELVFDFGTGVFIGEGKSERFEVFADVDGDANEGDTIELDFEMNSDIFAVGEVYGFGVSIVNDYDTTVLELSEVGSITVKARKTYDQRAYWGQKVENVALFRFEAEEEEGFYLEELELSGEGFLVDNVDKVELSYMNDNGSTLVVKESVDNDDTVKFEFATNERPFVPADGDLYVYVNLYLIDDDEELSRLEDFKIVLDRYEATGKNSDEEVENFPELAAKDGLWTYAGFLTLERLSDEGNLDENDDVEFRVYANTLDYTLAFTDDTYFDFNVVYKQGENSTFDEVEWTAYVDGTEVDAGFLDEESVGFSIEFSEEELDDIELTDGDYLDVKVKFSGDFDNFDYDDGDRFTVELDDVDGSYSWVDAYDNDDHEDVVESVEDMEDGTPLKFKYRND